MSVASVETPPQGMSSSVFFIKTTEGKGYVVKYGIDAAKDLPALRLISEKHIDIPPACLARVAHF